MYGACTLFGWPFNAILLGQFLLCHGPSTPIARFGLLPLRSPLLWESLLFSFPAGTKMFQFPAFSHTDLWIPLLCWSTTSSGLPHSDISGSLCTYHSPKRFAVRCVLRQLLMPRHPPYALINLITIFRAFFRLLVFLCVSLV